MSLLDNWRAISTQKFIPLQASLELTYKCNERCTHCYLEQFWDDPKRVLSLEDWKNILVKLKEAGSLYLILMGGEAMIHPHFFDILSFASSLGFSVSMISNGLKIKSLEMAQRLRNLGLVNITFSVYSLRPEIHDKMTAVRGSLKLTLQALEFCQQAGITVGVNTLLTQENIEYYFEVADWCIERKIEIKADPNLTPKMNGDNAPIKLRPNRSQLSHYYQILIKKWPEGKPTVSWQFDDEYVCNVAKGKCAVNPYGDLLACLEVRESLGNLKEKSFQELWFSDVAKKWRGIKNSDVKLTKGCSGHSYCEHCPGMSKHETGDPLAVPEYTKMISEVKNEIIQGL